MEAEREGPEGQILSEQSMDIGGVNISEEDPNLLFITHSFNIVIQFTKNPWQQEHFSVQ